MGEITVDLSRIQEIQIERIDESDVRVWVEGRIDDDDAVDEVLRARKIEPVSLTVDIGDDDDERDAVD